MPNTILSEIARVLDRSQHVLLVTHVSPDGDAIGSLLGLGHILREQGKAVSLVDADPVPPELQHLPGAETISRVVPDQPWDAIVALDASDTQRLGAAFDPDLYRRVPVIAIDHHVTNLRFGDLNCVDPSAAATAQIVVHLADAWNKPISRAAAECLLTGLVTDTRGFRTSNVTTDVMSTAIRLMAAGADLADIVDRTLNYQPLGIIRLWGPALQAVELQDHVAWTYVTQHMRSEAGAPDAGEGGLVSFLLNAPEVHIAAVLSEKPDGRVDVSLRARPGLDVSTVALDLGGGGHPQAAGCTLDGPISAAQARVLPMLLRAARSEG